MKKEVMELVQNVKNIKKFTKVQQLAMNQMPIISPLLFNQWGIDLLGPFLITLSQLKCCGGGG